MVTTRVSVARLDRSVEALTKSDDLRPIDRAHLQRFFPVQHAAAERGGETLARAGLDDLLVDHLMPRISDPTLLLRGRFMSLLTGLTRELAADTEALEQDPVARLGLAVLTQELRRCTQLNQRLSALLEA